MAQNLLISHLEFRTEESKDVEKYVFERSLETVVVQLDDKLMEIRSEYMKVIILNLLFHFPDWVQNVFRL